MMTGDIFHTRFFLHWVGWMHFTNPGSHALTITMSAQSPSIPPKLVTITFHEAQWDRKKRKFVKEPGVPAKLELEVLGHVDSFEHVAEALFSQYLEGVLGEELYDHVWRFEVDNLEEAHDEVVALDNDIPILSPVMKAREPYQLGMVDPIPCVLQEGLELIFFYNERSATRLIACIESISDIVPIGLDMSRFPRVKGSDGPISTHNNDQDIASSNSNMESSLPPKVVTISFHEALWSNKKKDYVKRDGDDAILELEMLGHQHSLENVAESLFEHYLGDVLGERLNAHLWHFDVRISESTKHLNASIPLLSHSMIMRVGLDFIFFYDEGTTTRLACRIESIEDLPPSADPTTFPRVKGVHIVAPTDTDDENTTIDSIFPSLTKIILSPKFGPSFFGAPMKELYGAVEAGVTQNGDQIFAPLKFRRFEDYLITAEKSAEILLDPDPDIRDGWTNVYIFPPEKQSDDDEERYQHTKLLFERVERFSKMSKGHLLYNFPEDDKPTEGEQWMMCGPKSQTLRLSPEEMETEREALRSRGFDFDEMFPRMSATLNAPNEKFNYFKIDCMKLFIYRGMKKGSLE